MSRWSAIGKGAGRLGLGVGVGLGVVAAGAAVGFAAERYAVGRSFRRAGRTDEPFGTLRSDPTTVLAEDGVPLHVEVDGAADGGETGLTVVFSHGYGLNQDSWHYQRRDLRDRARLVFWDQRGHGRSGRGTRESANIDQLGRDLGRVLEETTPDGPVVLVGHSMGGMTVMALADQFPELFGDRVVGVVLISTSSGRLSEVTYGVPAAGARLFHRYAPGLLTALTTQADLVERGRRIGSDLQYVLAKRYSYGTDVSPELVRFTADMLGATPFETVADFFPGFGRHDKLAALPVLDRVPAVVVAGTRDLLTPVEHSQEIARAMPGAEMVELPGGGHLVMLEFPDAVNHHIDRLLRRVLARRDDTGPTDRTA